MMWPVKVASKSLCLSFRSSSNAHATRGSRLLHSPLVCHACRHAHFPYGFSSKRETARSLVLDEYYYFQRWWLQALGWTHYYRKPGSKYGRQKRSLVGDFGVFPLRKSFKIEVLEPAFWGNVLWTNEKMKKLQIQIIFFIQYYQPVRPPQRPSY